MTTTNNAPQIKTLIDTVSTTVPDIDYHITGILRSKSHAALLGRRKHGKSHLAMQLGLSLATGNIWLGRRVRPDGVSVLYLNHEISEEKFELDLQDMMMKMGILPTEKFMHVTVHENLAVDINPAKLEDIIKRCPVKPEVLFLDPRYGFMREREDEQSAMNEFMNNLKKIQNDYDLALMTVAHMGKNAERGARGHSLFEDAIDTIMTLSAVNKDNYTHELSITGRDIEETKISLVFDFPLFKIKDAGIVEKMAKVDEAKAQIFTVLEANPDGLLRSAIMKILREQRFSDNSGQRALDKLIEDGTITIEAAPGMAGNHKLVKLTQISVIES